jgi:hypothetical protein
MKREVQTCLNYKNETENEGDFERYQSRWQPLL